MKQFFSKFQESICVCEVHEGGAASADGRIRKGDIILACNEYSFRTVNYADAIRVSLILQHFAFDLSDLISLTGTKGSSISIKTIDLKRESTKIVHNITK